MPRPPAPGAASAVFSGATSLNLQFRMTSLVGASVLLIAASALALVFGWVTANESLIWTSIAASVASGVALALAYGRARSEGPVRAPPVVSQDAEAISASEEPKEPQSEEPEGSAPADQVVGVRHTKRFHKPTCRYAAAKNAEPMSKDDALAHGYRPCAICGP